MSATCFDPWLTDANSIPFFRCCVLCYPWFSVCHSCRSQACNATLIFQIACETFARFVCSLENRFFRRCFTPEGPIAVEVGSSNFSVPFYLGGFRHDFFRLGCASTVPRPLITPPFSLPPPLCPPSYGHPAYCLALV